MSETSDIGKGGSGASGLPTKTVGEMLGLRVEDVRLLTELAADVERAGLGLTGESLRSIADRIAASLPRETDG